MSHKLKVKPKKMAGGGPVYPPVPPAIQALAQKHGLQASTGRGGALFFRGSLGEQLALKQGDEFLDLVSIGAEKAPGGGKKLLELVDEAAKALNLQARRGTTNLSAAGQASIEKAVKQGFATKNPAGPGFLSTAQPAGNAAMIDELVSNIGPKAAAKAPGVGSRILSGAKSAAGGVTALLEPMWGLIQNTPEGQEFLRNSPLRSLAPRQAYQQGGSVPSNKGGFVRVPVKQILQGYASGGPVAAYTNPKAPGTSFTNKQAFDQYMASQKGGGAPPRPMAAPNQGNLSQGAGASSGAGGYMGQISGTANQLANFNPQSLQQVGQTAGQLSNFNPLQGQAGNTLQGFIQSGNAVDVNPLVQAAQTRAQQGFQDFMGQTNERFGALGLGSSSAREAALGREAGRLQQGIAATGLEAGVGAEENARQRQLQAFNPLLAGSGQQLQGLQAAGGLYGQQAGLQQQGLQSAGQLQAGQAGLVSNERMQGQQAAMDQQRMQAELQQQAALQNQQLAFQKAQMEAQLRTQAAQRRGSSVGGAYGGVGSGRSYGAQTGGLVTPEGVERYASGGRVNEGDYLSNLLYGVKFDRGGSSGFKLPKLGKFGIDVPRVRGGGGGGFSLQRDPDAGIRTQMLREQLNQMQTAHGGGRRFDPASEKWKIANTASGYGADFDRMRREQALQFIGAGGQGGGRTGLGGLDPIDLFRREQFANKRFERMAPPLPQKAEGGVVPGPAVPPDQVPIMAQGGEGVLPVKMMHDLMEDKSGHPLIRKMQKLMGHEPGPSMSHMQRKARGGKIGKVLGEFKAGTLRSGSPTGPVVTDRAQAIAIALSEARKAGEEVKKMAHGGLVKRSSAFEPNPQPTLPTGREFQNFRGPVEPGVPSFSITGSASQPPEVSQGRIVDPTEDARMQYEQARGRSALLRTLALKSPQGALAKLSPIIGQADQDEAAAFQNYQAAQGLIPGVPGLGQVEAQRAHETREGQATRESELEKARIEAKGLHDAAAARNPNTLFGNFEDEAGGAGPSEGVSQQGTPLAQQQGMLTQQQPQQAQQSVQQMAQQAPQQDAPQAPNPVEAALSMGPDALEQGMGQLLARPDFQPVPELRQVAEAMLMQLLTQMSEEEILAKYPVLLRMAE